MFAVISAAIMGAIAVLWKVFSAGRAVERGKAAQQTNKEWADANQIQDRVQLARRGARYRAHDNVMSDDGFRRPKS